MQQREQIISEQQESKRQETDQKLQELKDESRRGHAEPFYLMSDV